MVELKTNCYKGTRITIGNEKRAYLNKCVSYLIDNGFTEIDIPIIQYQELFKDKVGPENGNMMFNFQDAGERDICLAPEYTAIVQRLAKQVYKYKKDLKLFYIQECFRGEKPQAGRYRQFTQLGVEILNPSKDYSELLRSIAKSLVIKAVTPAESGWYSEVFFKNLEENTSAKRGLDYYTNGTGFELAHNLLGGQKQICGGGPYDVCIVTGKH